MDLSRLWGDIDGLRTASAWLQAISISFAFATGLLQIGKLIIDRREKTLSSAVQAEQLNPNRLPIRVGSCTVEVVEQSDEQRDNHFMDRGGYLAFARGDEELMVLAATESHAKQTGQHEVVWRGVFNLDAHHPAVGKPVRFLRDSEYVQIGFVLLPRNAKILRGRATVTINSLVQLDFSIPEQQIHGDHITIPGVSASLHEQLK